MKIGVAVVFVFVCRQLCCCQQVFSILLRWFTPGICWFVLIFIVV